MNEGDAHASRGCGRSSRDSGLGPAGLTGLSGALAHTRLFSLCSTRELRKVAKVTKIRTIPKGTRLMTEGDDGGSMYVLIAGVARVSRNGRKVAQLGAGDAVGELAVLAALKPQRHRRRRDRSRSRGAQPARAEHLVNDVPSFSLKLLEAMATRVRELDKRLYP